MNAHWKIYSHILLQALKEMSDLDYQRQVWLNKGGKPIQSISFIEAANNIFDDALISEILENDRIVYDKKVTQALHELDDIIEAIDEFRPEEDIINDPLMDMVRQKAAECLALIEASDASESTVEIVE